MFDFKADQVMKSPSEMNESAYEVGQTLTNVIFEANMELGETISKYRNLVAQTLQENDNVYDDSIKTILNESAKDILKRAIKNLSKIRDTFVKFSKLEREELSEIMKTNSLVIDKYEPLLKQLDTSKCTYEMADYCFNKFSPKDMVDRLQKCIRKDLGFAEETGANEVSWFGYNDFMEKAVRQFNSNYEKSLNCIKNMILGFSPSVSVTRSVYDLATEIISNPSSIQTRYFNQDIFKEMNKLCTDSSFDELDNSVNPILKMIDIYLVLFKEYLRAVTNEESGQEYNNSVIGEFCATKMIIITTGLSYIEGILQLKLNLVKEKCANYRKVIINTYEKLVGSTGGVMEESYNPENDHNIQFLHTECAVDIDNDLF